jgi:hypothetical protein
MIPWSDFWVFVVWIATIATQGAEVGHDEVGSGSAVDGGWGRVGNGNTGQLSDCVRSLSWVLPLSARIQPLPDSRALTHF